MNPIPVELKTDVLKILQGDCVENMRNHVESGSVQLAVTSPPYDNLRTYEGFAWDFEATAKELYRVLCDGGICCWNVADALIEGSESLTSFKQAIFFVEKCGFLLHDTMIWHKLNFSSPSFTRYHQCFEYVFVLSKGDPRCFNPIKDKLNSTAGRVGNLGVNTFMKRDGSRSTRSKHVTANLGMRHNVWKGKTRGQEGMCKKLPHPAMMPKWLVRDLILSWSNAGDTVLDPMAGSGTTGVQAIQSGRSAILCELSPKYVELIERNCDITPGFKL